jgi:hypothetical protein
MPGQPRLRCSTWNAMEIQSGNVGLIIQLAIAPAFLLVGIGTQIRVLANRLARIVDRRRVLEQRIPQAAAEDPELDILYRRMHLIHRAITLSAVSALLVCIMIVTLFVTDLFDIVFNQTIAGLFVFSMLSLIASFLYFLREIFLATTTLAIWLPKGRVRT